MTRGDIIIADLPMYEGSVQNGTRVCIVIQNDVGNTYSSLTIVVPCTRKEKPQIPTHFCFISTNGTKNTVLCEQILTIPKSAIKRTIDRLSEEKLKQLDECLKISLQLGGAE